MTRQENIKKLIHNHSRRLQLLKEQKALAGWSVDPGIPIEIEDIEAELRDLQIELAVIESRDKSNTAPASSFSSESLSAETAPCILVVEDEPDLLKHLSLTLEMANYQLLTAKDGAEALALLQLHQVDLILSDISMPSMSGYQLYNRVCENPRWVMIPFIFLSARSMDSDIYYGKELGVDDYLTKPLRSENLLSVIQGKLRRAAARGRTQPLAV
jgi:CheY-like chemotaxis protein